MHKIFIIIRKPAHAKLKKIVCQTKKSPLYKRANKSLLVWFHHQKIADVIHWAIQKIHIII